MIIEIEKAIQEFFDGLDESEEFKRKFSRYIQNSLESTASGSDLEDVLFAIEMEVNDEN